MTVEWKDDIRLLIRRVVFLFMTTTGNVFSLDWRILGVSFCLFARANGILLFVCLCFRLLIINNTLKTPITFRL